MSPRLKQLRALKDTPVRPRFFAQGALDLVRKDACADSFSKPRAGATSIDAIAGLISTSSDRARGSGSRDGRLLANRLRTSTSCAGGALYASVKDLPKTEETSVPSGGCFSKRAVSLLATLYLQQGKLDQALNEFKTLAERQPKSVGARTMVGALLQTQNRRDEAKKAYREALLVDSSAPVAANNLAWMMVEDNANLDDALQLVQGARTRLPDSPEVNDTLGWIYYKKGLQEQAMAAFKQSVEKEPNTAIFHFHLGLASTNAGQYSQARQALETPFA
jgi:tetratricopeptide (TPR) repeat protein